MQRFILNPQFNNLSEYKLKYTDILTYITIRSFYNTQDKYCYPSYQTISKRSGLSKKFISESIKRLECAGFLDVWKIGKFHVTHYYRFPKQEPLQKISDEIFECNDLTASEKSMLLIIAEYRNSSNRCEKSISELSGFTGLTVRVLNQQIKSLILKGYLAKELEENLLDKTLTTYLKLTDKLRWNFPGNSSFTVLRVETPEPPSGTHPIVDMAMNMLRPLKARRQIIQIFLRRT